MSARARWLFGLLIVLMAAAVVSVVAESPQNKIQYVAARPITNPDGALVYQEHCAVCHGVVGRGNGPAAKFLDTPVPDLSRIAIRDGSYDRFHVVGHVKHVNGPAGTPMPCWQRTLQMPNGDRNAIEVVMVNLTDYLQRLQVVQ